MRRRSWLSIVVAVLMVACASAGPSPTPGPALSDVALKYRLLDEFGALAYCDPDEYPVGRDEVAAMRERWPELAADAATLAAITTRLGLDPADLEDDDARLAIYRQWKVLNAIVLDGSEHSFDLLFRLDPTTGSGTRVAGTIAADGRITVTGQQAGQPQMCPICLAVATRIATPDGDVAVENVRVGMTVWSVDAHGRRVAALVIRIGRTPVPVWHEIVRLELADGRVVRASPGHPLADGRLLGSLGPGDRVDASMVVAAERERYRGGFTYDLLTSSASGAYLADGVVLGSTLPR